jgi:hypothetical protein
MLGTDKERDSIDRGQTPHKNKTAEKANQTPNKQYCNFLPNTAVLYSKERHYSQVNPLFDCFDILRKHAKLEIITAKP